MHKLLLYKLLIKLKVNAINNLIRYVTLSLFSHNKKRVNIIFYLYLPNKLIICNLDYKLKTYKIICKTVFYILILKI